MLLVAELPAGLVFGAFRILFLELLRGDTQGFRHRLHLFFAERYFRESATRRITTAAVVANLCFSYGFLSLALALALALALCICHNLRSPRACCLAAHFCTAALLLVYGTF